MGKEDFIISIVTPSFNQGRFIEETIQSVFDQDGDFFLEYVIVDGGSTDETLDIVRKYDRIFREKKLTVKCRGIKFEWISEKDNGQADAINKGIQRSNGQIVGWLNSDDSFLPGAIRRIIEVFTADPEVGCVYGRSYYTDLSGKTIGSYPTEVFDFNRLATFNFISQPSTFFKRRAFEQVGGLDPKLHYALDYDLWIRIAKKFPFTYIDEFLSCYRLHPGSKTVDQKQAFESQRECLEVVYKNFRWAPLNRVFGYQYQRLCTSRERFFHNYRAFAVILTLFCTVIEYFKWNKKLRVADVAYLKWQNIKRLGSKLHDRHPIY